LLDQARAAHRAGDLRRAEQLCRRAVESQPANADGWPLLAAVLIAQNKHAEAADAYQHALRLRPDAPDLFCGLASALAALNRRDEAEDLYRRALRLQPGHADALAQLGLLL